MNDLLNLRILNAKYCPNIFLWEDKFRKVNSWFWKSFAKALEFVNDKVGWVNGKGECISVWNCNWIHSDGGLKKLMSCIPIPNLVVKDLLDNNGIWNEDIIRNAFNDSRDVHGILKMTCQT